MIKKLAESEKSLGAKEMNKDKTSLNKLFYNNRFVLLFSILLAIIIWLIVALQFSPEVTRVIKDVPVKIESSNNVESFNLQLFGNKDFTVDVTVVGRRYVVSQSILTADDIVATAKTNYVDSAGKYSLSLDVQPKSQSPDYSITNVSNDHIEVYFDEFKEGEYTLIPEIVSDSNIVPEGYFKDQEVLSANTVSISGPATEINKISKVYARTTVEKALTFTKTFETEIIPLGEYGGALRYLTINNGNADITLTIPVYKLKEFPVSITYKNAPAYYLTNPLVYTCNPKVAMFGVNENNINNISEISAGIIDFNALKAGINSITIKSEDIKDAKVMGDIKSFKITIDASDLSERKLSVPLANITTINKNQSNSVNIKSSGISNITVVGKKSIIDSLTADDIFADVDLDNKQLESGSMSVQAKLYVKSHDNCWVYGQYSVDVVILKIQN